MRSWACLTVVWRMVVYWSKQNEGWATYLKHTTENIFADMHCTRDEHCFLHLFFIADLGFVIGTRENGLGSLPNILYAGKTLQVTGCCQYMKQQRDEVKHTIDFTWKACEHSMMMRIILCK